MPAQPSNPDTPQHQPPLPGRRRWPFRLGAVQWVGIGALIAVVMPALLLGPWLPLIDLVSFVGMDAYPPHLSYGPVHYYTFQFTYIGHVVVSRLFSDLQIPPRYHIVLFYLLQVGVCFGVVWRSLERLVASPFWRAVGIAAGTLAFWDGVFLWGGPLAYSLAGASLTAATFLAMREAAEPQKRADGAITLLVAFAILCHPFAVPFALILCGLRFLFSRGRRWRTVALAIGIAVFAFVILKDSPPEEASAAGSLKLLFGFNPAQIWQRLTGLFHQDALFAQTLFGATPLTSSILFVGMAVLHVAGFLISPYIALRAREVWLRMLATLNTVTALLYLFSWDFPTSPIPEWPQRILTLYAPFTYLAGFSGIAYVVTRFRTSGGRRHRAPAVAWLVPIALLVFAVFVQVSVFRFGRNLGANVAKVRAEILQTGVSNAYVVVAGIDRIRPFYLRCVPFMLFSDPALIARHVLVATEWHFQDRHPSRITENWFNLGRTRYLAEFSSADATLHVQLVEQPVNRFPIIEDTNLTRWGNVPALALDQFKQGVKLFNSGFYAAAFEHFNTAIHLKPGFADAWNNAGVSLLRLGNLKDAVICLRKAIDLDPKTTDARRNLATAMAASGDVPGAVALLEDLLRLKPDDAEGRALLERLRQAPPSPPAK